MTIQKSHDDDHYTAAVFRYLREYARVSCGRCRAWAKVIVRAGTNFEVSDHDFTKFSIIPSRILGTEARYRGQVLVGFKEAAFEHSHLFDR